LAFANVVFDDYGMISLTIITHLKEKSRSRALSKLFDTG